MRQMHELLKKECICNAEVVLYVQSADPGVQRPSAPFNMNVIATLIEQSVNLLDTFASHFSICDTPSNMTNLSESPSSQDIHG